MSKTWKIIGIAALIALAIFAVIKAVILVAKILFVVAIIGFIAIPVAIVYWIYTLFKKRK